MSSIMFSVAYHERMVNNSIDVDEGLIESTSALSYETEQEKAICISKTAEQQGNMRPKGKNLEAPNSNPKCVPSMEQHDFPARGTVTQIEDDNVINI